MSHYRKSRPNYHGQSRGARGGARSSYRGQRGSKPRHQGAYIDPSKYINHASVANPVAPYIAKHEFSDFAFCKELHANIARRKYQTPSAIQDQAIPHILGGRDLIGLANTGTGKTAAFLLPVINKLRTDKIPYSVLILAPTRELAQQIDDQFRLFADGMGLYSALLVGGSNIDRQMTRLKRRPHIIIATPGRMMDLVNRKKVPLGDINTFVLDEADRMLDMGFIGSIRALAQDTPKERQTLFFSATITPRVQQITAEFLRNPEIISAITADTSERVDQDVIEVSPGEDKIDKLLTLLCKEEFEKVLLFGKTKYGVQRLSDQLRKQDISSVAIHGNKSQSQRQSALRIFRDGKARVMVATDVAARGLDIPNVSHVINFDQPATYEDYVHRIGRTGRGDAVGVALTFIDKR